MCCKYSFQNVNIDNVFLVYRICILRIRFCMARISDTRSVNTPTISDLRDNHRQLLRTALFAYTVSHTHSHMHALDGWSFGTAGETGRDGDQSQRRALVQLFRGYDASHVVSPLQLPLSSPPRYLFTMATGGEGVAEGKVATWSEQSMIGRWDTNSVVLLLNAGRDIFFPSADGLPFLCVFYFYIWLTVCSPLFDFKASLRCCCLQIVNKSGMPVSF